LKTPRSALAGTGRRGLDMGPRASTYRVCRARDDEHVTTMRIHLPHLAISALLSGCLLGTAIGELDNAADCNTICNRHAECVQGRDDLRSCVERCEERSDADDRFMDKVDECESCIDANSCAITQKCESQCAGIGL
jgi:hypothetical protein